MMTENLINTMRILTNHDQSEFRIQTRTETLWSRIVRVFNRNRVPTYYWSIDSDIYLSKDHALKTMARIRERQEFIAKHGGEYRVLWSGNHD